MIRLVRLFWLPWTPSILLIFLGGCGNGDSPASASRSPATQASPSEQQAITPNSSTDASSAAPNADREIIRTVHFGPTRKGRYLVRWESTPTEVPLNQLFAMDLDVFEPDGKTPFAGKVAIDAWMPAHRHGLEDVEPTISGVPGRPGRFHVVGMKLHMPG